VYVCGMVNYRFAKMFLDRALLPARRDDSIALPLRSAGKSASAHRLAVQDVALSRRKQGFDSPWARQGKQVFMRCFVSERGSVRKFYGKDVHRHAWTSMDEIACFPRTIHRIVSFISNQNENNNLTLQ
jgi:hypothetical protein